MIGAIVGDIVGSRFEFANTTDKRFELFGNGCDFTDDTICTVAIADAILKGIDYRTSLLHWCRQYPNPKGGYGGSFAAWLRSADPQPYNSWGNGSAMRVSPVAWAFSSLDRVVGEAALTASPTHSHEQGIKGAVAVAHIIHHLRTTHRKQGVATILAKYYPDFMQTEYQRGVFDESCAGTVPVCGKLLLSSTSFEDAIRKAITWGGDSDTIGAIVGSMAEAIWGVPDDIRDKALSYLPASMLQVIDNFNTMLNNR